MVELNQIVEIAAINALQWVALVACGMLYLLTGSAVFDVIGHITLYPWPCMTFLNSC